MIDIDDNYLIWHPFSQMYNQKSIPKIKHANGCWLHTEDETQLFDAIASWWVNLHGHSHPEIAQAVFDQMQHLEHVIFAGFTHDPAIQLCEKLNVHLPKTAWKYFFSDNGSTAVEVALKMAIQYIRQGDFTTKINVIALEGSYHGDTFGAMSAASRSVFTDPWDDLLFDVTIIPPPVEGKEEATYVQLENALKPNSIFIYEPLVLGAAGMVMYTASALENMLTIAQNAGALLIADEVMTGFGRTGNWFASNTTAVIPDFICLSKGLTGGALPMALTVCRQTLYDAFLHPAFEKGFLHGHSFTGNPVGCAAALASLKILEREHTWEQIEAIQLLFHQMVPTFAAHPWVSNVRTCGTIIAMDVKEGNSGYIHPVRDQLYDAFISKGVLIRPLGNVIYILPPYCAQLDELKWVMKVIFEVLDEFALSYP